MPGDDVPNRSYVVWTAAKDYAHWLKCLTDSTTLKITPFSALVKALCGFKESTAQKTFDTVIKQILDEPDPVATKTRANDREAVIGEAVSLTDIHGTRNKASQTARSARRERNMAPIQAIEEEGLRRAVAGIQSQGYDGGVDVERASSISSAARGAVIPDASFAWRPKDSLDIHPVCQIEIKLCEAEGLADRHREGFAQAGCYAIGSIRECPCCRLALLLVRGYVQRFFLKNEEDTGFTLFCELAGEAASGPRPASLPSGSPLPPASHGELWGKQALGTEMTLESLPGLMTPDKQSTVFRFHEAIVCMGSATELLCSAGLCPPSEATSGELDRLIAEAHQYRTVSLPATIESHKSLLVETETGDKAADKLAKRQQAAIQQDGPAQQDPPSRRDDDDGDAGGAGGAGQKRPGGGGSASASGSPSGEGSGASQGTQSTGQPENKRAKTSKRDHGHSNSQGAAPMDVHQTMSRSPPADNAPLSLSVPNLRDASSGPSSLKPDNAAQMQNFRLPAARGSHTRMSGPSSGIADITNQYLGAKALRHADGAVATEGKSSQSRYSKSGYANVVELAPDALEPTEQALTRSEGSSTGQSGSDQAEPIEPPDAVIEWNKILPRHERPISSTPAQTRSKFQVDYQAFHGDLAGFCDSFGLEEEDIEWDRLWQRMSALHNVKVVWVSSDEMSCMQREYVQAIASQLNCKR